MKTVLAWVVISLAWVYVGHFVLGLSANVGGSILAVALLLFMAYKFMAPVLKDAGQAGALQQHGVQATAKILSVEQTGIWMNENPQVELTVSVQPVDGTPYTAKIRDVVKIVELPRYQPGQQIGVRVHPQQRDKVSLDRVVFGAPASGQP